MSGPYAQMAGNLQETVGKTLPSLDAREREAMARDLAECALMLTRLATRLSTPEFPSNVVRLADWRARR